MAPFRPQASGNCKPRIGAGGMHTKPFPDRHTPRRRGIQYAAASRFYRTAFGILDHPPSRMMTAEKRREPRPSRAQRVGILDHIGPAAGGSARREQHEARGHERPAREIAAYRKIIGHVLAR